MLRILYLGDIMARPGREIIAAKLPALRKELAVDLVIGQAENVSHGKSMTPGHMQELQAVGVDFFTGGNHTVARKSLHALLADANAPVTAPINLEGVPPEWGAKIITTPAGDVLIVSVLGDIVPQSLPMHNPIIAIDTLLASYASHNVAATVVNFHGDYSSQKKICGLYLDGRVSMVVGDHWHVQTADAEILTNGTAYQTDVGMCGTVHSSLGISYEPLLQRWRDDQPGHADIAVDPPFQINALCVDIENGKAVAVRTIREIYPSL